MAGEQGLEFADDLLGGGFRDQVTFDFLRSKLRLKNAVPLNHISDPENVPGAVTTVSGRKT